MRIITLCIIFAHTYLTAQPTVQWQKCLGGSGGDDATSVWQTTDGGYAVAGFSTSNDGDASGWLGSTDYWFVKLDASGNIQWQKMLGGTKSESIQAVQQTSDGGYFLAGRSYSNDYDVEGNHGKGDYWLVKLNSIGEVEWKRLYGGSGDDWAYAAQQTSDGGYIVAGDSYSSDGDVSVNKGYSDFWIIKLNNSGNIEWEKSYGGSATEFLWDIKQTNDGGYVVVGETGSNDGDVSGNNGNTDMWVVKLSSDGALEWQNALGGIGIDVAYSVVQAHDGGYMVLGLTASGNTGDVMGHHGDFDYWVVKLDSSGELLWQKPYGGTDDDWGRAILQDIDGDYILAGESRSKDGDVIAMDGTGSDWWVLKINELGSIQWRKAIGGNSSDNCQTIQQTSDGGFIMAGHTYSTDLPGFHGGIDFWVVKLSAESSPVTEALTEPLDIYPNPATQSISVSIPSETKTFNLIVNDLLGREVLRQARFSNGNSLQIEQLPTGIYAVKAVGPSGKTFAGKFKKE